MVWYRKITVEIPLLLCFFSFLLVGSLMTNLIYYRTCYNILGHDEASCSKLGDDSEKELKDLEEEVQKSANVIVMVLEMPPALIPVFINMFAGAWSDRYGRKPVLLVVIGGMFLSMLMFGILVAIPSLSPWTFLIAAIPSMLTGSTTTYFTVTLAYLNDISTPETRGIRMAIYEAVMVIGMFCGTFSSSYLFYATNYETCFFLASALIGLGFVYTVFFIPESLDPKKLEEARKDGNHICDCRNITDNFRTAFKKRDNNKRTLLFLVIAILTLNNFAVNGEKTIKFPFLRKKLDWNLTKNNIFNSIMMVLSMGTSICSIYFLYKKLKLNGFHLCLVALISSILSSLLLGLAINDFYVFGAALIGLMSGITSPILRTELGEVLPAEEMGKVFGLINTVGAATSLAASFLYVYFYNATLDINAAIYNFISMGIYSFSAFMIIIIIIRQRNNQQ